MAVFLLPEFIADLQSHNNAHFARRVLLKTLLPNGEFKIDPRDHRYHGIDNTWIRRVSGSSSAYRVIYIRIDENVYLYRAGEHHIEDRLKKPRSRSFDSVTSISQANETIALIVKSISLREEQSLLIPNKNDRFRRNVPQRQIYQEIFSRRNLPHTDIWLITPFINKKLFYPTAQFGELLLKQVEDGANVIIVTSAPSDRDIEWMETLAERDITIVLYPRLHTKLYCFLFDENRKYEPGLQGGKDYSSLMLVGSANLTSAGIAINDVSPNEELCYMVPEEEVNYITSYVIELIDQGYELPIARQYLENNNWNQLENKKW